MSYLFVLKSLKEFSNTREGKSFDLIVISNLSEGVLLQRLDLGLVIKNIADS